MEIESVVSDDGSMGVEMYEDNSNVEIEYTETIQDSIIVLSDEDINEEIESPEPSSGGSLIVDLEMDAPVFENIPNAEAPTQNIGTEKNTFILILSDDKPSIEELPKDGPSNQQFSGVRILNNTIKVVPTNFENENSQEDFAVRPDLIQEEVAQEQELILTEAVICIPGNSGYELVNEDNNPSVGNFSDDAVLSSCKKPKMQLISSNKQEGTTNRNTIDEEVKREGKGRMWRELKNKRGRNREGERCRDQKTCEGVKDQNTKNEKEEEEQRDPVKERNKDQIRENLSSKCCGSSRNQPEYLCPCGRIYSCACLCTQDQDLRPREENPETVEPRKPKRQLPQSSLVQLVVPPTVAMQGVVQGIGAACNDPPQNNQDLWKEQRHAHEHKPERPGVDTTPDEIFHCIQNIARWVNLSCGDEIGNVYVYPNIRARSAPPALRSPRADFDQVHTSPAVASNGYLLRVLPDPPDLPEENEINQ